MKLFRRVLVVKLYDEEMIEPYVILNGDHSTTKQVKIDTTITKNNDLSEFAQINIHKINIELYNSFESTGRVEVIAGWIDDSIPFSEKIKYNTIFLGEIIDLEYDSEHETVSIQASVSKIILKTKKEIEQEQIKNKNKKSEAKNKNKDHDVTSLSPERKKHLRELSRKQNVTKNQSETGRADIKKTKPSVTDKEQKKQMKPLIIHYGSDINYEKLFNHVEIKVLDKSNPDLQKPLFPQNSWFCNDYTVPYGLYDYADLIDLLHKHNRYAPFYLTKEKHEYTAHAYDPEDMIYLSEKLGLVNKPKIGNGTLDFTTVLQPHFNINDLVSLSELEKPAKPKIDESLYQTPYIINEVTHNCSNYKDGPPHTTIIKASESEVISVTTRLETKKDKDKKKE